MTARNGKTVAYGETRCREVKGMAGSGLETTGQKGAAETFSSLIFNF